MSSPNTESSKANSCSGVLILPALHGLMFASGAFALIYEVLWMRRFTAVFGATTPAIAATLTAVFLGLTAGSWIVGRRATRWARPLMVYGVLEIAIGLSAALVEPILQFFDGVYPSLYHAFSGNPGVFAVIKTLLAVGVLFVPTFCMGGTVPLLANGFQAQSRHLGVTAGGLYSANTFGAAVGAFSVPFFWLPILTARASYGFCIAGSLAVGVVALWLDVKARRMNVSVLDSHPVDKPPSPSRSPHESSPLSSRELAGVAALSGFLLFILQVVWSRMFAQVHENSIYSFSLVVAVLLIGLAAGAAVARWWVREGRSSQTGLGLAWLAAGAVVLVTPSVFFGATTGLSYVEGGQGWASYGLRLLWLALPTVFLPTLLAGMVLPIVMELAGRISDEASSRVLGRILAYNTAGSIAGSLVAAFFLPAALGVWLSLVAVGVVMIVAGELCLGRKLVRRWVVAGGLVATLAVMNPWQIPRTKFRQSQGEKLVAIKESSHGIVAVVEHGTSRRIKLNNYYVLGGTASTGDERIQAHLPLLLHPAPKRVAFLGVGTGITAGAALLHSLEQITAVELVPDVLSVAREHFADANLRILESPRVRAIADDARNFVRGSGAEFDVIVGDLFVPWHRGEASLYTADHFESCRSALAPGGFFCQWLPLFQLSEEEFNIVTATFLEVFPRATLWRGDFAPNEPAIALIGHREADATIDPVAVERRIREKSPDDTNPALAHPAGLWMFLAGPLDLRMERFAGARRNRENQPWLEILGPLNHAGSPKGQTPIFVGRRLEAFLDQLRASAVTNTSLARMSESQVRWRSLGAKFAEISNLTVEGRQREAGALLEQTVNALPVEIRPAFGSPPPAGSP